MDPFDRDDLPAADRVIAAPVHRVYAALDDLSTWADWNAFLAGPVERVADDHFRLLADGRRARREIDVIVDVRGTSHTLYLRIPGGGEVRFRTRPHATGTRVEAVRIPTDRPASWRRRRVRAQHAARQRVLEQVLASLARHVEANGAPSGGPDGERVSG